MLCFFFLARFNLTTQQNISFIFNAQHDCEGGKCGYAIDDTSTLNSQAKTKVKRTMLHSNHDIFFINLHALHNAQLIREVLPRNLTKPIPYVIDREEFHYKMAKKLQKRNPKKRAKAKEKAKETRENKKRAMNLEGESSEGEESENELQSIA